MSGAGRIELPEVADVLHRRLLVAGEVKEGVDQHRAVTGREDEPVPVMPMGSLRIVFQIFREEHGSDVGHRSAEHTSELQSLMRTSYAVFCLKKKINHTNKT